LLILPKKPHSARIFQGISIWLNPLSLNLINPYRPENASFSTIIHPLNAKISTHNA
jgi:hypothetical protein